MSTSNTPQSGDLVVLTFDPQAGHEQMGRRPALVISNDTFNRVTGMAIVCPITNTDRGIPFHVPVPEESNITGFVMVEQVKSVDFKARRWQPIGRISSEALDEVLAILAACIERP